MSEFGIRKCLLIEKTLTEKMGDPVVPQVHLALWTRLRIFKGYKEKMYVEVLGASANGRTLGLGHLS